MLHKNKYSSFKFDKGAMLTISKSLNTKVIIIYYNIINLTKIKVTLEKIVDRL